MRPAPGWILVRPVGTDRTRGKPDHCVVIEMGKDVPLALHAGAQILVRWDATDRNEIERPVPAGYNSKAGTEKVWLIRATDVCGLGVAE